LSASSADWANLANGKNIYYLPSKNNPKEGVAVVKNGDKLESMISADGGL